MCAAVYHTILHDYMSEEHWDAKTLLVTFKNGDVKDMRDEYHLQCAFYGWCMHMGDSIPLTYGERLDQLCLKNLQLCTRCNSTVAHIQQENQSDRCSA